MARFKKSKDLRENYSWLYSNFRLLTAAIVTPKELESCCHVKNNNMFIKNTGISALTEVEKNWFEYLVDNVEKEMPKFKANIFNSKTRFNIINYYNENNKFKENKEFYGSRKINTSIDRIRSKEYATGVGGESAIHYLTSGILTKDNYTFLDIDDLIKWAESYGFILEQKYNVNMLVNYIKKHQNAILESLCDKGYSIESRGHNYLSSLIWL